MLYRILIFVISVFLDTILINGSIILAFFIRFNGRLPEWNIAPYRDMWVLITIIMIGVNYFFGLYNRRRSYTIINIIDNAIRSISFGTLIVFVAVYSVRTKLGSLPTSVLLISLVISIVFVSGWRIIKTLVRKIAPKRLLVIGKGGETKKLLENIIRNPSWGYKLVGIMDEDSAEVELSGIQVMKSMKNIRSFVIKENIEEIIMAFPDNMHDRISDVISQCQGIPLKFRMMPSLYEIFLSRTDGEEIDGLPLVEVMVSPIHGINEVIKRIIDIIAAATGLLLFLPVLLVLIVIYKLGERGSVFFKQERVGKDGKIFNCYKLRTMHEDAEKVTGPVLAQENDQRITRLGRFLRKFRIDEIPQLINILKGDMSLIGPRPERPFFVEKHKKEIKGYVERLQVKPGITGLAQVNSAYDILAKDKLHYDLLYIRKQSLWLDLRIMLKTVWVMLARKGAR